MGAFKQQYETSVESNFGLPDCVAYRALSFFKGNRLHDVISVAFLINGGLVVTRVRFELTTLCVMSPCA